MKQIPLVLQEVIDQCKTLYDVEQWLIAFDLEWNIDYSFYFKNIHYSFHLIDSGVPNEMNTENIPKVKDLYLNPLTYDM